jgi:predicted  nucleic acid-binding Zn-ribbon protein
MKTNREGYKISETERECTKCGTMFKKTSKTVTLCNKCNSDRVKCTDPEIKMFQRAKSRAKIKKLDFTIERKDIIIPKYCPILEIELLCKTGISGGQKNSPALDRINPTLGYIKNNVRVISHLANMMKSYANNTEMLRFANWVNENIPKDSN